MTFEYIKKAYGLELKRGQLVKALGKIGKVTSANCYVKVRFFRGQHPIPYHPDDIEIETQCGNCGLKHFKGTKCNMQPEGETWVHRPMREKKCHVSTSFHYGEDCTDDCENCLHYHY